MSNLIPEKRADRNGRIVTRHVVAPGTARAPLNTIPRVQPMTDLTKHVAEFQKLNFLMGAGSASQLNELYPVAGTISRAAELCGTEPVRDLYRTALYDDEPDWVKDFSITCHFVSEAGGIRDLEAAQIAIHHAAKVYGSDDLLHAEPEIQDKVVELVGALKVSHFVVGVAGHGGSLPVDIKRHKLLDYLCSKIDAGTLKDTMPAIKEIDGFINFWDDEQEDDHVVNNLDYIDLIGLMEYVREKKSPTPEAALAMVRSNQFRVNDVRDIIDGYEGASVLINGSL